MKPTQPLQSLITLSDSLHTVLVNFGPVSSDGRAQCSCVTAFRFHEESTSDLDVGTLVQH